MAATLGIKMLAVDNPEPESTKALSEPDRKFTLSSPAGHQLPELGDPWEIS
jgi:hypothetical protein